MREPRAALAPVDAERLQPLVQRGGQPGRVAGRVVEHQHPDAPRLPVADRGQRRGAHVAGRLAECADDRRQVGRWAAAEEGERHVHALPRHHAPAAEVLAPPGGEDVQHRVGEGEREEEPEPLITRDASRPGGTAS